MPVCPRCDVAYLDGEKHQCQARRPGAGTFAVGILLLLLAAGAAKLGIELQGSSWFSNLVPYLGLAAALSGGFGLLLVGAAIRTYSSK